MIYSHPKVHEPLDQADLIDECPVFHVKAFSLSPTVSVEVNYELRRVVVVTQACDLPNEKTTTVNVAEVFDARQLIDQGVLKAADIKGPIRAGRVWGLYFLPAKADAAFGEMIVDMRRLHTVRRDLLGELCAAGRRLARVQSPYREHLAKHFADTFSRIGLPQPYETM
jgi:hypothetical protein